MANAVARDACPCLFRWRSQMGRVILPFSLAEPEEKENYGYQDHDSKSDVAEGGFRV